MKKAHWFVQIPKADPPGFGLLPFRLRAVALMLLRVADEGGRINVGTMTPAEAVIRLCGASGRERAWLRKSVGQLLEARAFVLEGSSLTATDWACQVWPDASLPPMTVDASVAPLRVVEQQGNDTPTTPQRQGNDHALTGQRQGNDRASEANPAESLGAKGISIIEEQNNIDIDRDRGGGKAEKALSSDVSRRPDDLTDAAIVRGVVERWLRKIGQPTNLGGFSSQALINESLGSLRAVAESEGVSLDRATGRTLLGFEADQWSKEKGYPLGAWARRPGKFLPLWHESEQKRKKGARLRRALQTQQEKERAEEANQMTSEELSEGFGNILDSLRGKFSAGGVS